MWFAFPGVYYAASDSAKVQTMLMIRTLTLTELSLPLASDIIAI